MALDLSKFGGKRITKGGVPRNLIVDVCADTKCGTTRFALKAPRKRGIAYINFDRPLIEVQGLKKLLGGAELQEVSCQDWSRDNQDAAKKVLERVKGSCQKALADRASTVVVDKATDLHAAAMVALYGRTTKIMQRDRGPINEWWTNFLHPFKNSDTNLILIHRWGEKYLNDKPTGLSRSKGWGDISYHATMCVEMGKDRKRDGLDKFWLEILDCTFDTSIEGEELRGKLISFAELAMMVIPTSDESDWE